MASATRSSLSNLRHFFSRLASVSRRPNNAFKPKPLRSAKHMAGTACHVLRSTTRLGLTSVLGVFPTIMAIRQATATDLDPMWDIYQSVIAAGDVLPFSADLDRET